MVMDVLSDRLLLLVTYEGMDPKLPLCLKRLPRSKGNLTLCPSSERPSI